MPVLRFQTKLTLVYLALFLAVQGVVLIALNSTVPSNVRGQIERQLSASARVFERIIGERLDQLSTSAHLLSQDFGFREAVASQDEPTVLSVLKNQKNRLKADIAFVQGLDDTIIATTKIVSEEGHFPVVPDSLKEQAERSGAAASIMEINNHLYELVVVPIRAPILVAWMVFGLELDTEAAEEIKSLSPIALDIAFLHRKAGGAFQLAAATSDQKALSSLIAGAPSGIAGAPSGNIGTAFGTKFDGQDYMFWRLPLENVEEDTDVAALLYYSVDVAMAPYVEIGIILLILLSAGLIILVIGSLIVSRGITRPLRRLALATRNIAEGDYQEVVAPTKDVEIARLTRNFNQMVRAVKEREHHIRFQAHHDIETGLPNRLLFKEGLINKIKSLESFSVVLVEVQDTPELRSVLNHSNVNNLMTEIGERLHQVSDAEAARLSTETFALVLDDLWTAEITTSLLVNSFLTPFEIADIVVDVGVKIGLVKYPDHGEDFATLLRHAHVALDQARTAPKGFAWYSTDSDISRKQRLSLMSELRGGLENGEVRFAYQPKLDLAKGKITAVEALVRWISPEHGFIAPDDFIPLAERTGDVRHLTQWGLNEAIRQCADWKSRGIELAVAVNLSSSDLMNTSLPSQILSLMREHDLPSEYLKLEVTESAVMHDMARALDVLNMLAKMGLSLSIDDYGTGYSSLSYIKKLPVDEIKIDKSFVLNLAQDEEDNILVRSTIELSHNLGLRVTAEGVEDEETVEKLRAYGCDTIQGYHISRPLSAEDLEKFLKESPYG